MSLKLHRMQLPREVIVGSNTLELIGDICKKLDLSKSALIVTGSHTKKVAGQKVMDLLADHDMDVDCVIVTSSTAEDLRTVKDKIKELQPQVVLGVGGGTKIDVAKLSSANQNIPFISVPTTASHDGIASPLGAIKGLNKPFSAMAQAPMAIVADTQ
ncbi:MAG: iron-containing alcohol dehydrogenase, partial [Candidatus Bathyarchaeia archaeon]